MKTFKERMTEWCDWDGAMYELGICIGIFPDVKFPGKVKSVLWTDNRVNRMLHYILEEMEKSGALEFREEPDQQYRWSPDYTGDWEIERNGEKDER